jgi:hypothetical protein
MSAIPIKAILLETGASPAVIDLLRNAGADLGAVPSSFAVRELSYEDLSVIAAVGL